MKLVQWQLGPPEDYILREGDKQFLVEWALLAGHEPVAVHAMSAVDLANLYTGQRSTATDIQHATSAAIAATIAATIAALSQSETIRAVIKQELEALAPRRLEVSGPNGIVTIDGAVHYCTPLIIRIVALGHAAMLVGPAGCGKTSIGEHVAQALGLPLFITPTINETHELLGFIDGYGNYHATPFRQAFINGGVWIADEIDAWDASALLAANSALANGYAQFPDSVQPLSRHNDFRMVATANTFGRGADRVYVGRNELDAASLDRFATINVDYDIDLERMFAGDQHRWLEHVWTVRKAVMEKRIRHVVSSRAIAMGATALAAGIDWNDVNEIYLYKGMSENDRSKIDD